MHHRCPKIGVVGKLVVLLFFFGGGITSGNADEKPGLSGERAEAAGDVFFDEGSWGLPSPETKTTGHPEDDAAFSRSKQSGQVTQEAIKIWLRGDKDLARQKFLEAIALAPNNSLAYSFLAQIYFQEGRDDLALSVLEQAGRYGTYGDLVYEFLGQMLPSLRARNVAPVYPRVSLARFKDNKDSAICFTFDDGPKNVYTLILPVFDEFGYKATVFVNPAVTTDVPENPWWGSWQEWKDASRRGYEIGSHSFNHWDLTIIPPEIQAEEVSQSYQVIKEKIGIAPLSFAFPFDHSNDFSLKTVHGYYLAARERQALQKIYPPVFLPVYGGDKFSAATGERIIDMVVAMRLWMVAECHAAKTVEVMTFKPITTEFLRSHLAYIKSKQDKIWVDTFANQYRYLAAVADSSVELIEDSANKIVFKVVSKKPGEGESVPLTVVINPAPAKPQKATAVQAEKKESLPAEISGAVILVDVSTRNSPVEVRWE